MLKIRKDNIEKIVTVGCFNNLYKDMGYEIVNESGKTTVEPKKETTVVPETPIEEPKEVKVGNNFKEKSKYNYNSKRK